MLRFLNGYVLGAVDLDYPSYLMVLRALHSRHRPREPRSLEDQWLFSNKIIAEDDVDGPAPGDLPKNTQSCRHKSGMHLHYVN
jgi:hypothetical protein